MQNFVPIGLGVSAPQIRDSVVHFGVTSFFRFFFGYFNKATAYTPKRIFTQSTSEHVVPGKEVPFGGLDNYIWYLDPQISGKPPFWGPILAWLAAENRFNMGML